MLASLETPDWHHLAQNWPDGHVKLAWTRHLLKLRAELADVFTNGDYEPLPEDHWTSHTGYIHEVVRGEYLEQHPNLCAVEFYLCGPPAMIDACTKMLASLGVADDQIAYDEF